MHGEHCQWSMRDTKHCIRCCKEDAFHYNILQLKNRQPCLQGCWWVSQCISEFEYNYSFHLNEQLKEICQTALFLFFFFNETYQSQICHRAIVLLGKIPSTMTWHPGPGESELNENALKVRMVKVKNSTKCVTSVLASSFEFYHRQLWDLCHNMIQVLNNWETDKNKKEVMTCLESSLFQKALLLWNQPSIFLFQHFLW